MASSVQQSIDVLARALDQAADVLSAVPADKLSAPTPCSDWDVTRLMAHIVAAPANFVTMSTGGHVDWSAEPQLPDDWTGEFRSGADALLRAWREATDSAGGKGAGPDWQTTEFAVHTWDLARATGQSTDLDPEVGQRAFDFMTGALTAENRGGVFAPEVPVPDDATIYDRLAAFAGRDPGR